MLNLNCPSNFARLKSEVQQRIPFDTIDFQQIKKGEYIYLPTDQLEKIFVVEQGVVKLGSYSQEGISVTYDIVGPNDFFGNLRYLNNDYFHEFAKALTPLLISTYHLSTIKGLFLIDKPINDWLTYMIVKRWAKTEARLFRITSMKPAERVQKILDDIDQAIQQSTMTTTYNALEIISQKDIADLAGITRQTAAKILRELTTPFAQK